jgi:hypothetical protein
MHALLCYRFVYTSNNCYICNARLLFLCNMFCYCNDNKLKLGQLACKCILNAFIEDLSEGGWPKGGIFVNRELSAIFVFVKCETMDFCVVKRDLHA